MYLYANKSVRNFMNSIYNTGGPLIDGFWDPEKTVLMEICTIRGDFMV